MVKIRPPGFELLPSSSLQVPLFVLKGRGKKVSEMSRSDNLAV